MNNHEDHMVDAMRYMFVSLYPKKLKWYQIFWRSVKRWVYLAMTWIKKLLAPSK